MPHDPYKALYLHIPYCVKKCAYCDFTSYELRQNHKEIDEYVEQLVADIRKKSKCGELTEIETVYIGGGTPSFIGQKRLSSLLYALGVSMNMECCECTMEANPDSVAPELVRDVFALGVNRISLGVQSFDDEVLQTLGRAHTSKQAVRTIDALQECFDNISIDLMCGIPGQSAKSFRESLERAIEMNIPHVSIYPLTIERGTKFARLVRRGKMQAPDEDVQAQYLEIAENLLESAGYARYEVASYAKPGYECKHNIIYWSGVPYLGLGTSAATMTQNAERRMRVKDGIVTDDIGVAEMMAEDFMLAMRMSAGVPAQRVQNATNTLLPDVQKTFDELIELGLVKLEEGRYKPTHTGWLCGNEMFERIFELA